MDRKVSGKVIMAIWRNVRQGEVYCRLRQIQIQPTLWALSLKESEDLSRKGRVAADHRDIVEIGSNHVVAMSGTLVNLARTRG